ncbi:MAG: NAD(P)-binding domain-containing protein [Candidatus Omnitrophota bacterium]|nr:NAD(P)-binding domain-containing protein [Candidatus Omnitrophota bacterium]
MYFYLIGIDYKRSAIDARENLYRRQHAVAAYWANTGPGGSAVLVTCNRMEIYGVVEYADDAAAHIAGFFKEFPDFSKYAYLKLTKERVFGHALRLACGLESQIKGELQIAEQLDAWIKDAAVPGPVKDLWDEALENAQEIRAAANLNDHDNNIAAIVFADIEKKMRAKEKYEVLIIGSGKIAEAFADYGAQRAHFTFVSHRNHQKARKLAEYAGGVALSLRDLEHLAAQSDIVIGASSSPHYILKKEHFAEILPRRRYPLYIYDLAMPRDVEPLVAGIGGVCLYNLDTLEPLFSEHNKPFEKSVALASELIEDRLAVFQEAVHG